MTFSADDQFPEHPKAIAAGGDACLLWFFAGCYSARMGLGGLVPKGMVPRLSDRKNPDRLADRLVESGLWIDEGEHYRFHEWDHWNEPAGAATARKEQARRAAKERWRKRAASMPGASDEHGGEQDKSSDPAFTRMRESLDLSPNPADTSPPPDLGVAPTVGAEAEEPRIDTIVRLVAERQLAKHVGQVHNPPAWLAAAKNAVCRDFAAAIFQHMHAGLTNDAIVDLIEPPAPKSYQPFQPLEGEHPSHEVHANGFAEARKAFAAHAVEGRPANG